MKDFYANIGAEKMEKAEFQEAIKAFKSSLIYGPDKQIDLLIRNCEEKIDKPKEIIIPKPKVTEIEVKKKDASPPVEPPIISNTNLTEKRTSPFLKVLVGVLGGGSAIYALSINSDWNTKLNALNTAKESGNINTYETAYSNVLQAKNSEGLRNACVGIAVASATMEIYLLFRKPKSSVSKFSVAPSTNTVGLSLSYKL